MLKNWVYSKLGKLWIPNHTPLTGSSRQTFISEHGDCEFQHVNDSDQVNADFNTIATM